MGYIITPDELVEFRPNDSEVARFMHGHLHGFDATTVILTESLPGGGPVPHEHQVEEVHVIAAGGHALYRVGDDQFEVEGPVLIRLPAKVPHGFVNLGTGVLIMTCFLPTPKMETSFFPERAFTAEARVTK